jgi:hypothetical protein
LTLAKVPCPMVRPTSYLPTRFFRAAAPAIPRASPGVPRLEFLLASAPAPGWDCEGEAGDGGFACCAAGLAGRSLASSTL